MEKTFKSHRVFYNFDYHRRQLQTASAELHSSLQHLNMCNKFIDYSRAIDENMVCQNSIWQCLLNSVLFALLMFTAVASLLYTAQAENA
jgi:hypothetical protein